MGLAMINDDALGALALPDPGDAADQPGWLYRDRIVVRGDRAEVAEAQTLFHDLRAARKFPGQESNLVLIIDNDAASGGSVSIEGLMRTLVLKA